jgi:hypothetical protein
LSDEQEPRSGRTFEEQLAADLERHRREVDPGENEETTPPADERIETCCIWVTECYPPSHAAALFSSLNELGWNRRWPLDPYGDEVTGWLERARGGPYLGAWLNLGHLVRKEEEKRFFGSDVKVTELPEGIDYAYGYVRSLLPSLTILTMQFVLDEHGSKSLEDTVRGSFETRLEGRDGMRYFDSVANQKREAAHETRAELTARCCGWFQEHVPGLFSADDGATSFPRCELVVFDKARPFERMPGSRIGYLWPLDMGNETDAYEGSARPGVRLGRPSPFDEDQLMLVLAAKRDDLASEEAFTPYGGKDRTGIARAFHDSAEGLMSVWTLNAMLQTYERRLARLRDSVGEINIQDPEGAAEKIQRAQSQLVRLSTDMLPLTSEVGDLCEKKEYLLRLAPEFESLIEYPGGRLKFVENSQEDLSRRAARARELEGELREVVMTVGSVVGTVSQERSSQANLRLQGRLTFLTWVLVALTVVLVILTLVLVVIELT